MKDSIKYHSIKNSIMAKTLIIIAAVLFFTDAGLLSLGYYSVHTTVERTYLSYARSSAAIAADLLDGVRLEELPTDKTLEEQYRTILGDLCMANGLEYLYVYIPDTENDTITFLMLLYGENSAPSAAKERTPGTVVEHALNEAELAAWRDEGTDQTEWRDEGTDQAEWRDGGTGLAAETDNQFGHVLTCYAAVHDQDGKPAALVGADISMEETFHIFVRRYRTMFAAVIFSMIFILAVLGAILKTRVLKPAKIISGRMKNFITDRKDGFERLDVGGSDEFSQMADSFNQMAEEIDTYIQNINELTEEKHRQEAEIHIAKRIQTGFLQDKTLRDHRIRIKADMVPAKSVGGDFYDYFSTDEDKVCTVIADVSGKGISAALFMARAMTVVRQYAQLGYSPSEILFHTNNCLSQNNPEQMFLTVFVGIYNSSTHRFTYANGGHNTPYLISDTLVRLDGAKGMTVGIFEEESYEEETVTLKSGDTVFLYTDGVNEAVSLDKEFFGTERLEEFLGKNPGEACVDIVLDEIHKFARGAVQSDDITMLAFCVPSCTRIRVKAVLENLEEVRRVIADNDCVPDRLKMKLCLAAEEIFVNICSYAYEKEPGDVEFSMEVSDRIVMTFQDGGKPFNPLENTVDIDDYDMDTQIGGLGRLLATEIMDRAEYAYVDQKNSLVLIKNLDLV